MILLVVVHHVAQAYGPADWWYFQGDQHSAVLSTFSAVGGAFRMPLLFFVAAFFVPRSFERGAWRFVRSRLKRLGIPFLAGTVVIIPVLTYVHYTQYRGYSPISFPRYFIDVFLGFGDKPADWTGPIWPDLQYGHLWFIQNLLALSLAYVLGRLIADAFRRRFTRPTASRNPWTPNHLGIVLFTVGLALAAFLLRVWYPLDQWVPFLEFIQVEPARSAQYIAFFAAGILAFRHNWLDRLPDAVGYTWLAIGGGLVVILFATGVEYSAVGGFTWESLSWTFVETFICTGLSVGLVTVFRRRLDGSTRLSRTMAGQSYSIYIIHVPIAVALQFAFDPVPLAALPKFIVVAALAMTASVIAANYLRKTPGLRAVL